MLEYLQIPHNAQFYKLKDGINSLPNVAINNIISAACNNRKGAYLIGPEYTRIETNYLDTSFKFTLRVFPSKRDVQFVSKEYADGIEDIIHAYILILEFEDNVIIFKKSTATFTTPLRKYLDPLPHELILQVIDHDNSTIQRLSLRNMTVSGAAIHSQSYETPSDLKGLISPHAMGKAIPTSIRYKEESATKSVTASTARILESSEKSGIEELLMWAKQQIHKINLGIHNYFIDRFARPIDLEDVLEITNPRAILIEVNEIRDAIEKGEIQLGIEHNDRFLEFNNRIYKLLTTSLEETYEIIEMYDIRSKQRKFEIYYFEDSDVKKIGLLKINEKSLTFSIPVLNRIKVKQEDGSYLSLAKYVINKKLYSIVFNDIKYMYFMGQCFQDASGVAEIDSILEVLIPKTELNAVTSEKGTISPTHTAFDTDSMFAVIENIHAGDEYVFCDDLGNEWCDHLTINTHDKIVSFIHSKAKGESLSASNMHDVVSQGIKNLGNMFFTIEDFNRIKRSIFNEKYRRDGHISNIERIRKGDLQDSDINIIKALINDHRTHRQCILSCSFLSKSAIEDEFDKIKRGEHVRGNIVQLFWILSSFIHACRGMHVIPIIYCKE